MAYCVKCGAKVDDGIMICPQCGAQIPNVSGSYSGSSQGSGGYECGAQSGAQGYTYGQQGYSQTGGQGYGQESQQWYQSDGYGQSGQGYQSGGYGQSGQGYQSGGYGQSGQGYQSGGYGQYGYDAQRYGSADFFDQEEVRRNKAMGVLSYLGILVLIPLLAGDKRSGYVKHHVNQGLVLFLLSSLVDLLEGDWVWGLHSIIHFGGGMFSGVFDILGLVFFILMVMGIVNACKGDRKELPLIGKIRFFK